MYLLRYAATEAAVAAVVPRVLSLVRALDASAAPAIVRSAVASLVGNVTSLLETGKTEADGFRLTACLRACLLLTLLSERGPAAPGGAPPVFSTVVTAIIHCLRQLTSMGRAAACQALCALAPLQQSLPPAEVAAIFAAVTPYVAVCIAQPVAAADALDALRVGLFILSYSTSPTGMAALFPANDPQTPPSTAPVVEALLRVWVPLFLTRLFPLVGSNEVAWQASHEFALQCLLKFVASFGDAFRTVLLAWTRGSIYIFIDNVFFLDSDCFHSSLSLSGTDYPRPTGIEGSDGTSDSWYAGATATGTRATGARSSTTGRGAEGGQGEGEGNDEKKKHNWQIIIYNLYFVCL